ncbi:hypothetical protein STEG23_008580, partial [Scotinomys teguina]
TSGKAVNTGHALVFPGQRCEQAKVQNAAQQDEVRKLPAATLTGVIVSFVKILQIGFSAQLQLYGTG